MGKHLNRREFFSGVAGTTLIGAALSGRAMDSKPTASLPNFPGGSQFNIKAALNAYSFNKPLRSGEMTLFDVIDFCASADLSGLDATGYYFPGYPNVPDDRFVYDLKRHAFRCGLTITGTGVRNDFAIADSARRKADVQMVKNWIDVAEKLGAPIVRIFAGKKIPDGYTFEQALEWMAVDIRECAEYGKEHGVIVGLQNHNEFLKTADETIRLVKTVDSDWLKVILDTGSLRAGDPYKEIEKLVPYAASWQLKEIIWHTGEPGPVNMLKIKDLLAKTNYQGFLPIETLGEGDPKIKISRMVKDLRKTIPGV
ncbi:MAG TPA: sugar phosphate isomerase/epimerase family protein [Tichowtungia sp.]|nr:sugar phosphate isomerase/epimerase family protein [Tichowtungia sp.]